MLVRSTRLGDMELSEEQVLYFPHGLPGFLEEREFAYLPHQENNPFTFLQSVTEPDLTFIIVEPFPFFQDYEFELPDELVQELDCSEENPPQIMNIVSVPDSPEEMTANLLAPVVINCRARKAIQVVLEKTKYTTRHRLFPNGFAKQPGKESE